MTFPVHALTALLLYGATGNPASLAALLPDLPTLPTAIYGAIRREPVMVTVRRLWNSPWLLLFYRITHSLWTWLALTLITGDPVWFLGACLHLLLDLPHYGRLRLQPAFPLLRAKERGCLVPLSGGHDSVRCLAVAAASFPAKEILAVFADYDQPGLANELAAARYAAAKAGVELIEVELAPMVADETGAYPARNLVIIDTALAVYEEAWGDLPDRIMLGSRTPLALFDRFGDCAATTIRRHLFTHYHRPIAAGFPCMCLPDFYIRRSLTHYGFDLAKLYSTKTNASR